MRAADVPGRGRDARDPVLGRDRALVERNLGQLPRVLVPLERVCDDGRDVDLAPKVAREVAEVRPLLDDGARAAGTNALNYH